MKILILLLFLPFYSFSQNFMMKMDIKETREDTVIYHYDVKVIWGIKYNEICLLWGEYYPMCLIRKKSTIIHSRKIRESVEKFLKDQRKHASSKNIKVIDIFQNKWGEVYLIVIYMKNNTVIFINRVDDTYPYYSFISTN